MFAWDLTPPSLLPRVLMSTCHSMMDDNRAASTSYIVAYISPRSLSYSKQSRQEDSLEVG